MTSNKKIPLFGILLLLLIFISLQGFIFLFKHINKIDQIPALGEVDNISAIIVKDCYIGENHYSNILVKDSVVLGSLITMIKNSNSKRLKQTKIYDYQMLLELYVGEQLIGNVSLFYDKNSNIVIYRMRLGHVKFLNQYSNKIEFIEKLEKYLNGLN
jgi:amino acid permease